ncbi:MAG: imidazole glycerol phosphate synthase subunit HisF [bacterium]
MTLSRRVIACLDVAGGRVVKGTSFVALRDVGDPAELAAKYERDGADEIVFLDISASADDRATLLDLARQTAERLFIPLTIGGGVRTADDVGNTLRAGADKVSINSASVQRPDVITESADRFGSQCVVASIDAKRRTGGGWQVYTHGGRRPTGLDALDWSVRCAELGAGEVLLTSIDYDGARTGYDIELTAAVADAVTIPVIASGGAGSGEHIVDVFTHTSAAAALVAGIFHDELTTLPDIKRQLARAGIPVRQVPA